MKPLVTDKQLIPSKFGIAGTPLTLPSLENKVKQKMKSMRLAPAVHSFCTSLLDNSIKGSQIFDSNQFGISDKEFNIIIKDFGEITGAAYLLKTQKATYKSVIFPTGNEPLIDYILVTHAGAEEKFSAKAGQGGKPSVTAVLPVIEQFQKSGKIQGKHKLASEVINHISTTEKNGLYLGPLKAAKHLRTPGYLALIDVLKRMKIHSGVESDIPTQDQLLDAVNNAGTYQNCLKEFNDFFVKSGYKSNLNTTVTQRLIETPREGKEKKWGLLHYPITAELIKWLNTDINGAKDILTMAANTLTVTQVYLDKAAGNKLKYTIKGFSDAEFVFGSPSSMPRPTNNRIGFTMKKASVKSTK